MLQAKQDKIRGVVNPNSEIEEWKDWKWQLRNSVKK